MEEVAQFKVALLCLGPVHIGNGQEVLKKEYISEDGYYYFPDLGKLYQMVLKKGPKVVNEFERMVTGHGLYSLEQFLNHYQIRERNFGGYKVQISEKNRSKGNVAQFIRDPYKCPYIPGSSLKGALRTVISYQQAWLGDEENKLNKANQFYKGILVSDSKPLSNDDLIICNKWLWSKEKGGKPKSLNVYRESLKPKTIVHFNVTCYGSEQIQVMRNLNQEIQNYYEKYYHYFLKNLKAEFIQDFRRKDLPYIYIGGGSGFWTKVLLENGNPRRHQKPGRTRMIDKGTFKLTKAPKVNDLIHNSEGFYEMGKCGIVIREKDLD